MTSTKAEPKTPMAPMRYRGVLGGLVIAGALTGLGGAIALPVYFESKFAPAKEVLFIAFCIGHSHYLLLRMLVKLKLESIAWGGRIIF